jgi:hypothetical protein
MNFPYFKLIIQLLMIVFGAVSFLGALFNWRWFVSTRKYVNLSKVVGPAAARLLHVLLGLVVMAAGIVMYLGIIPM